MSAAASPGLAKVSGTGATSGKNNSKNLQKNASKALARYVYIAMKRHRELHFATTSYIVSSYSSHVGVDLREKFARKLLTKVVNRAQKKIDFKLRRLKIEKDHFILTLTSPAGGGRLLPKILQWVKSVFAKAWNRHYKLMGAFWSDRYDSEVLMTGDRAPHAAVLVTRAAYIKGYIRQVRRGVAGATGFARLRRILRL
jgi:hypothetical protein